MSELVFRSGAFETLVLDATITVPRVGAWFADLTLDAPLPDDLPTAVSIVDGAGGFELFGTVQRGGEFADRARVSIVGGAGGLAREVAPLFYRELPARNVLADLLRDCGERLDSADGVLDATLAYWVRPRASAYVALAHVLDALGPGAAWRVGYSGATWVGREQWPESRFDAGDVLDEDPAADAALFGVDSLPPDLLPGTVWQGRRVSQVMHRVEAGRARVQVLFEAEGAAGDRTSEPLERLVRETVRETLFHALWPARVHTQDGDGTLQLTPESTLLPPMVGVPIRLGIPGVSVSVASDARVLVGFEGGAPARPVALLWNPEAMTEIRLGPSATRGVARLNDTVTPNSVMATWITNVSGYINGIAGPGTVVPPVGAFATVTTASTKIKSE